MRTTAISQLKASLSHYLQIVKAGEEVLITDRGLPVAKIIPLGREGSNAPPHLGELERAGLVRIGAGGIPEGFWDLPRPGDSEGKALKALLMEREESE